MSDRNLDRSLNCEMNFWVKGTLYMHFKPAISTMYNQIKERVYRYRKQHNILRVYGSCLLGKKKQNSTLEGIREFDFFPFDDIYFLI